MRSALDNNKTDIAKPEHAKHGAIALVNPLSRLLENESKPNVKSLTKIVNKHHGPFIVVKVSHNGSYMLHKLSETPRS
jgi:hypothetical protein